MPYEKAPLRVDGSMSVHIATEMLRTIISGSGLSERRHTEAMQWLELLNTYAKFGAIAANVMDGAE